MTAATVDRAQRTGPGLAAAAVLLPVGPLAIGLLRYLLPYGATDDTPAMVAAVQADPGRQGVVLWLACVGVLALVPGLYLAASVARERAPRLTAWALGLSVPGYLALPVFLAGDQVLWSAVEAGLSTDDAVAVAAAAHPTVPLAVAVYVVGHVVGTVLLGLALLRSGRVPAWAAWAVAGSQPLHFVAAIVVGSPTLDLAAWSAMAVGMAVVAGAVLRTTPPRSR